MKGAVTGHYLAIRVDEVEKVSKGGIVLDTDFDDNKKNRVEAASTTGIVVSVGSMCWRAYDHDQPDWKPWCEVGDRVVFVRHSAKIVDDEGNLDEKGKPKKLFIIADENIAWNMGKPEEIL